MKKYFPHISTFILTFVIVFAVSGFLLPRTTQAQIPVGGCPSGQVEGVDSAGNAVCVSAPTNPPTDPNCDLNGDCTPATPAPSIISKIMGFATDILLRPLGWLSLMILRLASLLTGLAGLILNYVVWFTVVDMSNKIAEIGTIDVAWKTIRDIANMGFIFVLLYAAIRTILGIGSDTKKLIVNIVVVAILINFSLFFTKVVIDASNVLAITFYDVIAPGALTMTATTGLSNSLMRPLKIESLWNNPNIANLEGEKLIIIGVMGTIVSLIAAFVFFAVAIMFVIRFVVLIFVLILSPLAFMGFILPQLNKYKDQWLDALLGQAFFAPIYFMLTLIVIAVSRGLLTGAGGGMAGGNMATALLGPVGSDGNTVLKPTPTSIAIVVNFIIVIALLIASLISAKGWANKAGPGVAGLTKWATGAAGGATLGMAGRFGRGTVGRAGVAIGDSERLKERASKGGVGGMAARLTLATGRKTGEASFDVRGTSLGGPLEAGKAQKGGFAQVLKDKRKKEKEFADSLAPSDMLVAEAERRMETAPRGSAEYSNARAEVDRLKGIDEKEAIKRLRDERHVTENEAKEIIRRNRDSYIKKGLGEIRKESQVEESIERSPTYIASDIVRRVATDRVGRGIDRVVNIIPDVRGLKIFREALKYSSDATRSIPNLIRAKNRAAIAEIRKGKKTAKELIDEALKETGETTETPPPAAPTAPPPAPPPPPPTIP